MALEVIEDIKSGKLNTRDKVIIGLISVIIIVTIISLVVIMKEIRSDKEMRANEKAEREIAAKDSMILQLQKTNTAIYGQLDDKDRLIATYKKNDSVLQRIALNNNYLLRKLNENDKKISDRINSATFTSDSLLKVIMDNY